MRGKWVLAAAAVLAIGTGTRAEAQSKSGGIAIIPFGGYAIPGTLADDDQGNEFTINGAMVLGAQIELGLSKNLGIDVGVNKTFSQTFDVAGPAFVGGQEDISMTQITGSLVLRPGGRRPNGAVTPLFIEVGGGVTMYSFGSAASQFSDFDATVPMGFVGAGYNIPVGPRATIQLFGRAQGISSYSSDGLDALNAIPPATNIEGKLMLNFQAGVGFRWGR